MKKVEKQSTNVKDERIDFLLKKVNELELERSFLRGQIAGLKTQVNKSYKTTIKNNE